MANSSYQYKNINFFFLCPLNNFIGLSTDKNGKIIDKEIFSQNMPLREVLSLFIQECLTFFRIIKVTTYSNNPIRYI